MGMASGKSSIRIGEPSLHTTTVVQVLKSFDIECCIEKAVDGKGFVLECHGLGVSLSP